MTDVWTIERHLEAGSEQGRRLFDRFVEIVAAGGEYTTSVAKTTITFKGPRRGFAGARPKGDRLLGYFDVTYRVDDPRIQARIKRAEARAVFQGSRQCSGVARVKASSPVKDLNVDPSLSQTQIALVAKSALQDGDLLAATLWH